MTRRGRLLTGVVAIGLAAAGIGVAQTEQDPQDAQPVSEQSQPQQPVSSDPVADILIRQQQEQDAARRATEALNRAPPGALIQAQPRPAEPLERVERPQVEEDAEPAQSAEADASAGPTTLEEPGEPPARERRPVAIIQALDKTTAETMRFEVRVGGPPVRFRNSLIFTARACEVNAQDDPQEEAAAYLEIRSQPSGTNQPTQARQVFRGWMFASAPAVNPLEHPNYDAWVVGCRA
ncbi:DUF2155 domain-containing protein [Brevundimonas sp.]|uniref:DUF2155 domain-containing protein n=1 Tax=Brevundimonas sp. TaxID=1871086 RepID=UPI001D8E4343|nr:DUF2155 domain-containing protein [Brevundimonas sp.]MBA3999133.1 DUF2155 domain-containing protein [Brevundimonas sp.]